MEHHCRDIQCRLWDHQRLCARLCSSYYQYLPNACKCHRGTLDYPRYGQFHCELVPTIAFTRIRSSTTTSRHDWRLLQQSGKSSDSMGIEHHQQRGNGHHQCDGYSSNGCRQCGELYCIALATLTCENRAIA